MDFKTIVLAKRVGGGNVMDDEVQLYDMPDGTTCKTGDWLLTDACDTVQAVDDAEMVSEDRRRHLLSLAGKLTARKITGTMTYRKLQKEDL